jgi:magnesium transporter
MGYYLHGTPAYAEECAGLVGEVAPGGDASRRLARLLDQTVRDDDPASFLWVGLVDPSAAELREVGRILDLPELQVDDAGNPRQRAKAEFDGDRAFVVLKALDYVEETSDVETGQVSVFAGPGYALTVRFGTVAELGGVRTRLEARDDLLSAGPAAVVYGVLDLVVDEYLTVGDEVSSDIEHVEESVFSPHRSDDAGTIYRLKRENLEMRRAVSPLVGPAHLLVARDHPLVPDGLHDYFHDVGDHLLRVWDTIETNDQLLMTMLTAAISRQDLQQNSDMRRISAWVAIAAVPTMIAGIYGMNFDFMPELHWQYGYLMVIGLMATVCGLMFRAFKRSGWL